MIKSAYVRSGASDLTSIDLNTASGPILSWVHVTFCCLFFATAQIDATFFMFMRVVHKILRQGCNVPLKILCRIYSTYHAHA